MELQRGSHVLPTTTVVLSILVYSIECPRSTVFSSYKKKKNSSFFFLTDLNKLRKGVTVAKINNQIFLLMECCATSLNNKKSWLIVIKNSNLN